MYAYTHLEQPIHHAQHLYTRQNTSTHRHTHTHAGHHYTYKKTIWNNAYTPINSALVANTTCINTDTQCIRPMAMQHYLYTCIHT